MGFCLNLLPEACVGRQQVARPFDGANWFNSQIHSHPQPTQTIRSQTAILLKLSQPQETPQGVRRNGARDIEVMSRMALPILAPNLGVHTTEKQESRSWKLETGSAIF
jgi:hypothetical protein